MHTHPISGGDRADLKATNRTAPLEKTQNDDLHQPFGTKWFFLSQKGIGLYNIKNLVGFK